MSRGLAAPAIPPGHLVGEEEKAVSVATRPLPPGSLAPSITAAGSFLTYRHCCAWLDVQDGVARGRATLTSTPGATNGYGEGTAPTEQGRICG